MTSELVSTNPVFNTTIEIPIRQWMVNFESGMYNAPDLKTQCAAGWYDWFCRDTSLANKTKSLGKKVMKIAKSSKVDIDKQYVFFKNNCPVPGPLYDDFRICDLKSGDVIYTVIPLSGHSGKAEVHGKENNFKEPLAMGSWKDIKNFFGV